MTDIDAGEQAALHVPAGIPFATGSASNVSFSVTGVESDDTGTVTFRDDNPAHNVVVPIVGGVLTQTTVDLSGLAYGKITSVLTLNNDPSGNSFAPVRTVYPGQTLDLNATTLTKGTVDNSGTVDVAGAISTLDGVSVTNETVSGAASALALDGNGFTNRPFVPTTSASVSLTTTHANDVIIVDIVQNGTTVGKVSDAAGLTWHQRAVGGSGPNTIYEYYAIAPTALAADAITVNFTGTASYVDLNAFGISGANTSSPFDTNGSVPATPATSNGAISTSNANDLIFAGYRFSNDSTPSAGAGWTAISASGGYYLSEYQVVSAAQAGLTALASSGDENGGIVDAIVQGSSALIPSTPSAALTVDAGSTLDLAATTITGGTLDNAGTVDVTGASTSALNGVNVTNTTLMVDTGATLDLKTITITGGTLANTGVVDVIGGTTSTLDGIGVTNTGANVIVDAGATLDLNNATVTGGTLNSAGTVDATGASTSALNGVNITNTTFLVDSGATLDLNNTTIAGGTLANGGTLDAIGSSISTLDATNVVNSNGAVKVDAGSTLDLKTTTISGGTLANAGTVDVTGGSTSSLNGTSVTDIKATVTVDLGSTLDLKNTTITGGTLTNSGMVDVTGGSISTLDGTGVTGTNATVTVDAGSKLDLKRASITGGTLANLGTVDVTGGTTSTLDSVSVSNEDSGAGVLSIDGNAFSSSSIPSSSVGVRLTTSSANDVIVLFVSVTGAFFHNDGDDVSDPAHLHWHYVAQAGAPNSSIYELYAIAPQALSADLINVTFEDGVGISSFFDVNAFGISGVNTSAPFDVNGSIPATPATSTGTITTSNANDLIFAGYRFASTPTPAPGAGWTAINATGGNYLSEYQIVSTTQTGLVASASSADENGGFVDAVVQEPATAAVLTVDAGSTLDLKNTTVTGGTLTNSGTVDVTGGNTTTLDSVAVTNRTVAAGTGSPLALDGNGFTNLPFVRSTSASTTLTTANANDVIILDIVQNGASVGTVSDTAGLIWHQRAVGGSGPNTIYEYYAIAPNALSADAITVNFAGTASYVDLNAFGVSGANTSSPFDSIGSVPATPAASTGAISTGNANDLIFAGYRFSNNSTPSAGGGWTAINASGGYYLSEYQIVSTAQAGLVATASSGDQNGGIVDAIVQASSTTTAAAALLTVDAGSTLDLNNTSISGGTLSNGGTANVTGGTTSTLDNLIVTNAGGALTVDVGSTLDLNNATISGGALTNSGTVDSTGISALNGVAVTNSSLLAATGGILTIDPNTLTNTGTLEATTGGTLYLEGVAVINATGMVKVDTGSKLDLNNTTITGGTLTNSGTMDVTGGGTSMLDGVSVTNHGGVGGGTSTLALDGSGFFSRPFVPTTTAIVTLTTSNANDVIIMDVLQNGTTVSSVSDAARLSWHQRAVAGATGQTIYEYYAIAPSALAADNITVNFAGTATYVDLNAFAVSGASTSAPFDTNGSLPATSATSNGAISTSNANDFIFAGYRFSNDSTPSAGGGWTAINASGGYYLSEYRIASVAQTGLVATASSGDQNGGIVDAIVQAGPGTTSAAVIVDAGSTLDLNNTTITGGTLTNSGTVDSTGISTLSGVAVTNSSLLESTTGGHLTIDSPVTNTGNLLASGATLDITGAVTGNGTSTISGTNSVLEFGAASAQSTTFAPGALGILKLDNASSFSGTVAGLANGDAIDLANFMFSNHPTITNVTTSNVGMSTFTNVTVQDGALSTTIALLNQYANQFAVDAHAYTLTADSNTPNHGTMLQLATPV